MIEKFKLTEVWCKIAMLFVFSAFYVLAMSFPEKSRQFPQLLAVVSLILTVIALVIDFSGKNKAVGEIGDIDDSELHVLDNETKRERKKRYYLAWAIVLVSTGIGFLGGFLFTALCLFVGFAMFFGAREKLAKNAMIGVALTVAVYFVFGSVMRVPLLSGLLW